MRRGKQFEDFKVFQLSGRLYAKNDWVYALSVASAALHKQGSFTNLFWKNVEEVNFQLFQGLNSLIIETVFFQYQTFMFDWPIKAL